MSFGSSVEPIWGWSTYLRVVMSMVFVSGFARGKRRGWGGYNVPFFLLIRKWV